MTAFCAGQGGASTSGFDVSSEHLVVGLVAAALVVVCTLFHYEAMSHISSRLPTLSLPRRARIVALFLGMFVAHAVEVWIFGVTYWFLGGWSNLGALVGDFSRGGADCIYFSVATYTTLGYGDIVPHGPIRVLAATEALLGLTLITWSASFAFLQMRRDWTEFRTHVPRQEA